MIFRASSSRRVSEGNVSAKLEAAPMGKPGLVLPVLRRMRVVAVAVAVANRPVATVDHDLGAVPDRLLAGALDRVVLRVVTRCQRGRQLFPLRATADFPSATRS